MNRLPLILSPIAFALLAACAEYAVTPAPPPLLVTPSAQAPGTPLTVTAPAPAPLRSGTGRIEQIMPSPSAAAGGSVAASAANRFTVRMSDGTVQYLDATAPGLAVGEVVEITRDGFMRRPL
jgi:hypothetical protein